MRGTTDSEFIFVLLLSLLRGDSADAFQEAFEKLLTLIIAAMKTCNLLQSSKLKLALASPNTVVAVNFGSGHQGETDLQGDWETMRKTKIGSPDFLISTILEPLYLLCGRDFHKHKNSYDVDPCGVEPTTAILASEPLTSNEEHWTPLPFGSMLMLKRQGEFVEKEFRCLNL